MTAAVPLILADQAFGRAGEVKEGWLPLLYTGWNLLLVSPWAESQVLFTGRVYHVCCKG